MHYLIFKLDYEKEAYNYWQTIHIKPYWGYDPKKFISKQLVKNISPHSWNKSRKFLLSFLKSKYQNNKQFKTNFKNAKRDWYKIEKEYFKRLENITKHKIYTNKFKVYITSIPRCPYFLKENGFMINIFSPKSIKMVCAHEILHLQFHKYYWKYCRKKLNNHQTDDLKESLTILLNEEFYDLLKFKDKGYPNHKNLRNYLTGVWKKTKDFDKLVDVGIKYLS